MQELKKDRLLFATHSFMNQFFLCFDEKYKYLSSSVKKGHFWGDTRFNGASICVFYGSSSSVVSASVLLASLKGSDGACEMHRGRFRHKSSENHCVGNYYIISRPSKIVTSISSCNMPLKYSITQPIHCITDYYAQQGICWKQGKTSKLSPIHSIT